MARPKPFLSVQRVASILDIHVSTAIREIQCGRLPAVRVGGQWRIARADFKEYARPRRHGAEPVPPKARMDRAQREAMEQLRRAGIG